MQISIHFLYTFSFFIFQSSCDYHLYNNIPKSKKCASKSINLLLGISIKNKFQPYLDQHKIRIHIQIHNYAHNFKKRNKKEHLKQDGTSLSFFICASIK